MVREPGISEFSLFVATGEAACHFASGPVDALVVERRPVDRVVGVVASTSHQVSPPAAAVQIALGGPAGVWRGSDVSQGHSEQCS